VRIKTLNAPATQAGSKIVLLTGWRGTNKAKTNTHGIDNFV
jgi:hypothetical protein